MKRIFDVIFSLIGIILLFPVGIIICLIGYFETGSPIFVQERVGQFQKPFKLFKFRTMKLNTESVASHLADRSSITKLGNFLRKTKLDEFPQLINVLLGDMSLVGARPNLYNQEELIIERELKKVYNYKPGITGLAQINDIDMSTPKLLAMKDAEMYENLGTKEYFYYIFATILGKGQGDRIN